MIIKILKQSIFWKISWVDRNHVCYGGGYNTIPKFKELPCVNTHKCGASIKGNYNKNRVEDVTHRLKKFWLTSEKQERIVYENRK